MLNGACDNRGWEKDWLWRGFVPKQAALKKVLFILWLVAFALTGPATLAYDNGVAAGPGVLTQSGGTSSTGPQWSGIPDTFSRLTIATNSTISYSAYGHVNGQATLSAWLDGQPVSITAIGTNAMQWQAAMELNAGSHQLKVAALHPSGQFTALTTNSFTNGIAYQTTGDTFDNAGNITQRVWKNANGTTNRIQTLSWDARGRLHALTERDAGNSGYNWTAAYDGLNRRLATTSILVTNGAAFTALPTTINSYYDPQVEFLELGLAYGKTTEWKLYGPDLNGKYGGMNGTGGFDGVSPYLNTFYSTISDCRGNILGEVTNGVVNWFASRPTGYGAVPGYRPLALGSSGASVALSSAWRGRWMDITGYHQIGLRPYDPVSGRWLTYDSVWNERDPNYYSFAGGDPVNGFDADGRCVEGGGTATGDLLTGTANLVNNTLGATAYALSSSFAPDWSYQNLGGYAQNLANTVTGAAQFGYNVAATATYGAISPFAPDVAYNNYGGNVQQLMGQAPGFYGGNGQSTPYQIGYGTVTAITSFMGGEEAEVGNLGKVGEVSDAAADVSGVAKAVVPNGNTYSVAFQTTLDSTSYPGLSRTAHFQEANEALLTAIEGDPQFAQTMQQVGVNLDRTATGLAPRTPPSGWTWHHAEDPGVMQLVPRVQHTSGSIFWDTLHPGGQGGYAIWGK
jgi:RHS repeat-associated protein